MSKVAMPEAVAYLHQCRKKPTLQALSFRKAEPTLASKGYESHRLITGAQAEAYADARAREALEQAAQEVEHCRSDNDGEDRFQIRAAAAIRALIAKVEGKS